MYFQLSGTNVRLLGSMHLFPADAPNLPAWVRDAYEWSEVLIFEADTQAVLPFFKSSEDTPLRKMLEPSVWATLESIWPSTGPLYPLSSIHPWAALLLAPVFCQKLSAGVDQHLHQWANEHSKPIRFLETAKELVTTFNSVPPDEVRAGLKMLASDLSFPQQLLIKIHTAWLAEDIEGVYLAASQSPIFASPGLRHAILNFRNRAWATIVKKMLETSERTLIVVGALHLFGPDNFVQLLGHDIVHVPTAG